MRLWMVRHGPTHAKAMVGWTDIPADLSDGAALERLRDHLPDAPVVSSDLIRASATADALNRQSRLPHDPALREINFGVWEMLTFTEIEAQDADKIRAYWDTPGDITPDDGESWNAISARVSAAIDHYSAQGFRDLIVVAHFGAILTQVQRALKCDGYTAFSHKIDNLSVTDMTLTNGNWQIGRINHCP